MHYLYSTNQWVLFFFLYSFIGWVWETGLVSIREKRWVNRGFLYGSILPIYGFGAIAILFAVLPVEDNIFLVWLFGMIAATLLELVTGALMEKIFKVRYWDYSKNRLNFKGYICLGCSIGWGFFAIFLVRFVHPLAEKIVLSVPDVIMDPLTLVMVGIFAMDLWKSVRAALDLRAILEKAAEDASQKFEIAKAEASQRIENIKEETAKRVESAMDEAEQKYDAAKAEYQMKRHQKLVEQANNPVLRLLRNNLSATTKFNRDVLDDLKEFANNIKQAK